MGVPSSMPLQTQYSFLERDPPFFAADGEDEDSCFSLAATRWDRLERSFIVKSGSNLTLGWCGMRTAI
jgi:hypothetical protein